MTHQVLFVDDETAVTSGIRRALERAPFQVHTANSGQEALALLESTPIDVVVSDERMPGMSGSELLARVRDEFPDTVRMILSSQADLDAAVRAINEGGIYRFLLKPCEPLDLASSVEEALTSLENNRRHDRWKSNNAEHDGSPDAILERALKTISMVFQPIFHGTGESVYAYEALVRLDDLEISSPAHLFGLAEAVDRVADVDAAIRAAIALRVAELPGGQHLFVNVHPESLADERLFSESDALAPHAARVVLEVTERTTLHETSNFEQRIADLRKIGYRIALDDLGAGYAGLSSFALLAPDVVKLDMSLVRGVHEDPTRARLVRSMAALCREMDVLSVAEGVETTDELDCVVGLGCDLTQGYRLGRPAPEFLGGPADCSI